MPATSFAWCFYYYNQKRPVAPFRNRVLRIYFLVHSYIIKEIYPLNFMHLCVVHVCRSVSHLTVLNQLLDNAVKHC